MILFRSVAEFDEIISKFVNYSSEVHASFTAVGVQLPVLSENATPAPEAKIEPDQARRRRGKKVPTMIGRSENEPSLRFMIITSSDLDEIIKRYRATHMASRSFFEKLETEKRIVIVTGAKLLQLMATLYRQNYLLASEVDLHLETGFIENERVFFSIVSAKTLSALYEQHGSSLFFENIREFLGVSRTDKDDLEGVNQDIMDTLRRTPEKMLPRNNGITFKARAVAIEGPQQLRLRDCSIVNGCQTTMCIARAGDEGATAKVAVKIVEGDDAWDIAKSANHQNRVSRIDLDLAQFLRPQLIRKLALDMGYGLPPAEEHRSLSNILDSIHRDRVSYDAVRVLYLGFFSRYPNNMFASNYSELRMDILQHFGTEDKEEYLLRILFKLLSKSRGAIEHVKTRLQGEDLYINHFKRFFNDQKPQYQCLVAVLAACGCTNQPLSVKPADSSEAYRLYLDFLGRLDTVLERNVEYFNQVFSYAFIVIADKLLDLDGDESESIITQQMYRQAQTIAGASFTTLFSKLRMQMRIDSTLSLQAPEWDSA